MKLTAWSVTLSKGISYESLVASTLRNMVPDSAVGVNTAQPRTRILAFTRYAGKFLGTVRVYDTFWSAVWWGAYHISQASTVATISDLSWLVAVRTAWVWITRVDIFFYNR